MSEDPRKPPAKKRKQFGCAFWSVLAVIFIVLGGAALGPISGTPQQMEPWMSSMYAKRIARALNEYAQKHQGAYPAGKSSTEIFQALLDDGEVNDPRIFCWPKLPERTPLAYDQEMIHSIKPENICFDLTVPLGKSTPGLPSVFTTGYRIKYVSGTSAVPLSPRVRERNTSMAVFYADGIRASFRNAWWWFGRGEYLAPHPESESVPTSFSVSGVTFGVPASPISDRFRSHDYEDSTMESEGARLQRDGTIVKFIPPTFDAGGVKYQQLTPDGPLPL